MQNVTSAPESFETLKHRTDLPFVADGVEHDGRIGAVVGRLIERTRCAELTFAPDPGFLQLLRDAP